MSSLNEIYIKKETLETLVKTLNAKSGKDAAGVNITVSLNDASNEWGQNISAYVSQTKEQREAKKEKFYVGNGKTYWTKGETPVAVKVEKK